MKQGSGVSVDPPYRAAAVATLAVMALYVFTLAPTTAFWDASEYITTAHILGIPHPPGNPLFVILARAWELLLAPTGLDVAVRINLFGALMSALAHGCWFLVAHRILAFLSESRTLRTAGAALSVALSATAFTVWSQSNVNEKVYTVSLFTIALVSWIAFLWRDRAARPRANRLLLLCLYLLALSVGNHLMALLAGPALLLLIVLVRPAALLDRRLILGGTGAVVLGLSVQFFLPIRAAERPIIAEADPRCESTASAFTSIMTMGGAGCEALSSSLKREQYAKPSILSNPIDTRLPRDSSLLVSQLLNYAQYFDWQWARSVSGESSWFGGLRPAVTLLFLALGLFGAAAHYRRDRSSWAYVLTLFLTLSIGLTVYLNFKYGFTQPVASDFPDMREVRERDYFFIASFSLWGVWAGIGLATLWQAAARRVMTRNAAPNLRTAHLATAPVLAIAVLPLVLNWTWATRTGDYAARDWAYNALMSVGPYGVLITNGDNDTFPLWYLQEVEGIRQDVTVIVAGYLNTRWYAGQIRDLTRPCPATQSPSGERATVIACQRAYRPDSGAPYPSPAQPPRDSVLPLEDGDIANVTAGLYQVRQPLLLRAAGIESTIAAGTILEPADTFISVILQSSLGDRPVHFMAPSPRLQKLDLTRHTVRTGLTVRIADQPVSLQAGGIVPLPADNAQLTGHYIDLALTGTLFDDVFTTHDLPHTDRPWVDVATTNIMLQYAQAHMAAAMGSAAVGNENAARVHSGEAEAWTALVR